jgi:hypothetical protein
MSQWRDICDVRDAQLLVLAALAWASPTVVRNLISVIDDSIQNMSDWDSTAVYFAVRRINRYRRSSVRSFYPARRIVSESLHTRTAAILTQWLPPEYWKNSTIQVLTGRSGDPVAASVVGTVALHEARLGNLSTKKTINLLRDAHQQGGIYERTRRDAGIKFLVDRMAGTQAKAILESPASYPSEVIWAAEMKLSASLPPPIPLLDIAERDGWFD